MSLSRTHKKCTKRRASTPFPGQKVHGSCTKRCEFMHMLLLSNKIQGTVIKRAEYVIIATQTQPSALQCLTK